MSQFLVVVGNSSSIFEAITMKFLEDSQTLFEMFGYCIYDWNGRSPEVHRAAIMIFFWTILFIWIQAVSFEYLPDTENTRNNHIVSVVTIKFGEISEAHFTLSLVKPRKYRFFKYSEMVINQSIVSLCRKLLHNIIIFSDSQYFSNFRFFWMWYCGQHSLYCWK